MPRSPALTHTLQQADVHFRAGRMEPAQKLYRAILKLLPNQPVANSRLGAILQQRGQPEQAIVHLERALQAQPQQVGHWSQLLIALQCSGQPQRARELVEQTAHATLTIAEVERLRLSLNDPPESVQRHLIELYQRGSMVTTEIAARLFTTDYPDHLVGWQVLSEVLNDSGRLQESLEMKQHMAERFPFDVNVHANLARTQLKLGQYEAALLSARRSLQINPNMFEARHYETQAMQALQR